MASPQKEQGHTDIAHDYLEALMRANLSGCQYQIMLAVIRKTWGWQKKQDQISYGQIAEMTSLSRRTVIREIKKLVDKKLLLVSDKSLVSKRSLVNTFELQKDYDKWLVSKRSLVSRKSLGSVKEVTRGVTQLTPELVSRKSPTNKKNKTINKTITNKTSEICFSLATELKNVILINNPTAYIKPGWQDRWANDIRLMMGVEKRTVEQIQWVISYLEKGGFWSGVILSGSNFRDKFDKIVAQARAKHKKANKNEAILAPYLQEEKV